MLQAAQTQRSPITTEHTLDVLFEMKSDQTGRNLHNRQRADWRLGRQTDLPFKDTHERGRDGPTVGDDLQNSRLNELERLVHKLADEISQNKDAFNAILASLRGKSGIEKASEPALQGNGQYAPDVRPQLKDTAHGRDEILERLEAMQHNVEAKFSDLVRVWDVLGDRIDALEAMVEKTPQAKIQFDLAAVDTLAMQLESKLSALLDRKLNALVDELFVSLQSSLGNLTGTRLAEPLEAKLAAVGELSVRLGEMQHLMEQLPAATGLGQLTRQLLDSTAEICGKIAELGKRVEDASTAGGADLETLNSVLQKVEMQVDDTRLLVQGVAERFDELDKAASGKGIDAEQARTLIDETTDRIMDTLARQKDTIAYTVAHTARSELRLATEAITAREAEQSRVLASILENIARIEVDGDAAAIDTAALTMAIDKLRLENDVIHNATIKLSENQQKLASIFDRWSSETHNELAGLHKQLVTVNTRRSLWTRFRVWLYGTDAPFAVSWRPRERSDRN